MSEIEICTTAGCCGEEICGECTCCQREHCSYETIVGTE